MNHIIKDCDNYILDAQYWAQNSNDTVFTINKDAGILDNDIVVTFGNVAISDIITENLFF